MADYYDLEGGMRGRRGDINIVRRWGGAWSNQKKKKNRLRNTALHITQRFCLVFNWNPACVDWLISVDNVTEVKLCVISAPATDIRCVYWLPLSRVDYGFVSYVHTDGLPFPDLSSLLILSSHWCRGYSFIQDLHPRAKVGYNDIRDVQLVQFQHNLPGGFPLVSLPAC